MAALAACGRAGAIDNQYFEDFTTKQFSDMLNTTALWDTVGGELRLPPFEMTLPGGYDTDGYAYGVVVAGDYAYVADFDDLVVAEVFERDFDQSSNIGRSLVIDQDDEEIQYVRLVSTQTDSIYWYISADGGSVWDEVLPDYAWHQLTSPGVDLMWKSRHVYKGAGVNPACTLLEIEWLCEVGTQLPAMSVWGTVLLCMGLLAVVLLFVHKRKWLQERVSE